MRLGHISDLLGESMEDNPFESNTPTQKDPPMSEISVVTETKTVEVCFYPSSHAFLRVTHLPDGRVNIGLTVRKAYGNYEDISTISREELIELANKLLELAQ